MTQTRYQIVQQDLFICIDGLDKRTPPNLRRTIYCSAIASGGEKDWNFLLKQYRKSNNANEKIDILNALGCSRDLWVLQVRALKFNCEKYKVPSTSGPRVFKQ